MRAFCWRSEGGIPTSALRGRGADVEEGWPGAQRTNSKRLLFSGRFGRNSNITFGYRNSDPGHW